jgi:hypothetical protein
MNVRTVAKHTVFLGLLAVLGSPQTLLACSICGCGDPLQWIANLPLAGSMFRFALQGEYLTATAASDDSPTQTESLTQQSLNATVAYGPGHGLSLLLVVPLVDKDWTLDGGNLPPEAANPTGLGDMNLGLRYFFLRHIDVQHMRVHTLALSAGTTFPTGDNNTKIDGERIDQHAQLGTGAWGPYAGVHYALSSGQWNLTANASAFTHSTNDFGYKFGNAMRWGAEGQLRLGNSWALSLAGEGRYAKRDVSEGEQQLNTGGTVVALTPGVWWSAGSTVGLYARLQIPVVTDFYGEQTVGNTFQIGMQVSPQ